MITIMKYTFFLISMHCCIQMTALEPFSSGKTTVEGADPQALKVLQRDMCLLCEPLVLVLHQNALRAVLNTNQDEPTTMERVVPVVAHRR